MRLRKSALAVAIVASLIAAACGGDDDAAPVTTAAPATTSDTPDTPDTSDTAATTSPEAPDSPSDELDLPAEIIIGVPFDTSGSAAVAAVGTDENDGVRLAAKEINESGYLGDSQIVLREVDTQAEQQRAIEAVLRFVDEEVHGVVGFTLTPSFLASAPELQDAGIPTIAVGLSAAGVTEIGDYMFRVYPNMQFVIPPGDIEFAEAFGGTRVAYMYQSDAEAASLIHAARKAALEEAGYETVSEQTFTNNDIDVRAQLTAIQGSDPDIVVVTPLPGLMTIVYLQAAEVGIDVPIIASPDVNDSILEQAGPEMECLVYTTVWNPASDQGNNPHFLEYFAEHGPDVSPTVFHAVGYASMWSFAEGIRAANGVDGAAIRDALVSLDAIDTPVGTINFQNDRAAAITGVRVQVRDSALTVWSPDEPCER